MRELFEKVLNEKTNSFTTKVDLDVNMPRGLTYEGQEVSDIDAPNDAIVSFDMDEEWRSWGLKGIMIVPKGKIHILVTLKFWNETATEHEWHNTEKEVEIEVDFSKFETSIIASKIPTTINSLRVEVDANLQVTSIEIEE